MPLVLNRFWRSQLSTTIGRKYGTSLADLSVKSKMVRFRFRRLKFIQMELNTLSPWRRRRASGTVEFQRHLTDTLANSICPGHIPGFSRLNDSGVEPGIRRRLVGVGRGWLLARSGAIRVLNGGCDLDGRQGFRPDESRLRTNRAYTVRVGRF